MKLSVVIPTLNEEQDLPQTLSSLTFADEVLVIDSGSTDKTLKIAKKYNARVLKYNFKNFSDTRNYADTKTKGNWILSIDADVVVPPKLAQEIIKKISRPDSADCYFIGRINYIWGKPITVADWGPKDDNHIRLYKKGSGKWHSKVHEQFVPKKKSQTDNLNFFLLHNNYRTISEFMEKTNSYSSLAAKNTHTFTWASPFVDFFKRYFYKQGFKAGYRGIFLSYLQSIYYLNTLIKSR